VKISSYKLKRVLKVQK